MITKTILSEVRGIIISVSKSGIIIQPDSSNKGTITEAYIGRDYSKYRVGERVVHVSYTWKRPATKEGRENYARRRKTCPNEIDVFDYVTYNELSYDRRKELVESRHKRI